MYRSKKVVNQVHECAAADRAEMNGIASEDGEHGFRGFERFGRSPNQEKQLSGFGVRFGAGYRRIEEFATVLVCGRGKLFDPGHAERARLNQHSVPVSARKRAVFSKPNTARGNAVSN